MVVLCDSTYLCLIKVNFYDSFGYSSDTENELNAVKRLATEAGAFDAVVCNHWAQGGAGAVELAEAVSKASQQPSDFKFLYDLDVSRIVVNLQTNQYVRSGS